MRTKTTICKACGLRPPYKRNALCTKCRTDRRDKTAHARAQREATWRKLGVSPAEHDRQFLAQEGLCAICQTALGEGRDCNLDHDHATGEVRGLLCESCNTGLGKFRDRPRLLQRAVMYLLAGGVWHDLH